jgi:L-asparaginase II
VADAYAGGVPLVEVVRSGFVEGRHHGSVAVLDAAGALVWSAGDAHGAIFPRSSNKPMQAVGMLRAGLRVAEPADLAVIASSHGGEPIHVDRIRAMLTSAGLDEETDLACPPDLPLTEHARLDVLRAGGGPARIQMNCSGKHTGMLLTCLAAGWDHRDYRAPEHPLQLALRASVERLTGGQVTAVGVDGCGAPVFAISLAALAGGFLRLVEAEPGSVERAVADAMRGHPELVSGTGADDARLTRGVPGLLAKGGAEGVLAVALPGAGAVAIKIDDGTARGRMPILAAALARLDVRAPVLDELAEPAVLGGGRRVGVVRWAGS